MIITFHLLIGFSSFLNLHQTLVCVIMLCNSKTKLLFPHKTEAVYNEIKFQVFQGDKLQCTLNSPQASSGFFRQHAMMFVFLWLSMFHWVKNYKTLVDMQSHVDCDQSHLKSGKSEFWVIRFFHHNPDDSVFTFGQVACFTSCWKKWRESNTSHLFACVNTKNLITETKRKQTPNRCCIEWQWCKNTLHWCLMASGGHLIQILQA